MTASKSLIVKGNTKTKLYRDYNSFAVKLLKKDLDTNLKSNNTVNFPYFQNTFTKVLHKHAPIKKKILRFNNSPGPILERMACVRFFRKRAKRGKNVQNLKMFLKRAASCVQQSHAWNSYIMPCSSFMSKALRKAIMHRTKLKNITRNNGIFVSCYFGELRKTISKF